MKKIRRLSLLIILLLFGSMITVATAHAQSSDNYRMPWYSADSSGGGISTGNNVKLYSNVGQSIVGSSSNSKYKLTSGYGAFFSRDTRPLVMIVAALDNNLSRYWEQVVNSAEKALDDGQHVFLLIDGSGDNNSYVYELSPDNNNFCPSIQGDLLCGRYEEGVNRWTWTEDISHVVSLYSFITGAMDEYPHADSVTLSLIGHGSGWGADVLPGQPRRWGGQPRRWGGQSAGWGAPNDTWSDRPENPSIFDRSNGFLWDDFPDEHGSTASSISDLRLILEGVIKHTGRKIDLLYFDACSMGMAEVAYELRDTVRYLLVSESAAWGTFVYDQMIGAIKRGMDGREIGEAWLQIETDLLNSRPGYPFVLGLYDQSKIQDLATAMQKLSQSLGTVLTTQRALIIEAVTATERVESNYDGIINTEDSYVDLKHFVEQISAKFSGNATVKDAAEAVSQAVNATVIRTESLSGRLLILPGQTRNFDNTGGISFYFPSHRDELKREFFYNEHHLQWTSATGWDDFLNDWNSSSSSSLVRAAQYEELPPMPICNSTEGCEGIARILPGPNIPVTLTTPTPTPTSTSISTATSTPVSTTSPPTPTPTSTAPLSEAIISVSPISATIGQTSIFTVEVNINTQEPVYGYQIKCEFDPTILQHIDTFDGTPYVDVVNGGFLIPDLLIRDQVDNDTGTLSYAISLKGDKSGSQGNGTLIELPFYGLSAGVSAIDCSDVLLSNADTREIPVTVTNGAIKVSNSFDINFQIQTELRDKYEDIQACIGDVCGISNSTGDISFEGVPPTGHIVLTHYQHLSTTIQYTGTRGSILTLPTVYLLVGDLDQDGDIDITDIGVIANAFASIEGDPHWNALADVTNEGEAGGNRAINIFDMVGVAVNFNKTAPSPWNYAIVRSARKSSTDANPQIPAATVRRIHAVDQVDADTSVVLSPNVYKGKNINEAFDVEVHFENAVDVQGVHLQIQFDETKLAVRDCDPRTSSPGIQACIGDFLDVNNQFVVLNELIEPGILEVAITQLFPATPKEGDGQYATIRFTTLESGTSEIVLSKVHLVDDSAPIPQDVPAQAKDSVVSIPFYEYLPLIVR